MTRTIKILVVENRNIFEEDSADANRWRTMVEGLDKDGIELHIVFTQGYGSIKEFKKYGWNGEIGKIRYSYTIFLLQNSLLLNRLNRYALSPLLKKYNSLRLKQKIKRTNPEVIFLHPTIEVLNIYSYSVSKLILPKYKLMIQLCEYDDIDLISYNWLHRYISKSYSTILLNEILPKTDLLLVMTKHLLEYYRQYTDPINTKSLHLPMTVDIDRFHRKKKLTTRYIAYCGSSSFIKDGVDILIKSFSMISGKFPEITLKIAAFLESDGDKMLSLISELDLKGKVEYLGGLRREKIPDLLINAEILLLPRPYSKQAQGGFPTKLGEYLATGNPVCSTTVGEIPDYLIDNESVFFAEPGSVESFAKAMDRALSDPVHAMLVGENGKRVAELNFSMKVQGDRLYKFLEANV